MIEKQELLILMMGKLRELQSNQPLAEQAFMDTQPDVQNMWFYGVKRKLQAIRANVEAQKTLTEIHEYYQEAIRMVRINIASVKSNSSPQHNIAPEYGQWLLTRDELYRGTNEINGSGKDTPSYGCTDTQPI